MKNIIGAAVATATLVVAGCSGQQAVSEQKAAEAKDVTVATCGTDSALGLLEATVNITNSSSKRSNYSVDMTFESLDGRMKYGTGIAFVTAVEPGQTTTANILSGDQRPAEVSEITCRIVEVDRTSDVG